MHERADSGVFESRDGVRTLRAVLVASEQLGLHGVADVVEMHDAKPYPVEYKRGRPKSHRADEVQLCAQAMCLEEMTKIPIHEGALFYGASRRRVVVPFGTDLRELTLRTANEIRAAIDSGALPLPIYDPARCEACSLKVLCQPNAAAPAADWLSRCIRRAGIPE